MQDEGNEDDEANERARRLRRLLPPTTAASGAFENTGGGLWGVHSDPERVANAAEKLRDIVTRYFGGDPNLLRVADDLAAAGEEGLALLRTGHAEELAQHDRALAGLEAIVLTDGSRPSFLVRDGKVDLESSPAGVWREQLTNSGELLTQALPAVGRINRGNSQQGFEGTGFLVAPSLVMTNRHVLQNIATPNGGGQWSFLADVNIDFGHEYQGTVSFRPRNFKAVAFATDKYIDPHQPPNHESLDLVLLELIGAAGEQTPLAVEETRDWTSPDLVTYIVGYPGNPGLVYPLTLLEKLFQQTFGAKRLAPGRVMRPTVEVAPWTVSHDATTLGGNSGSAIIVGGRETVAAALHYGGKRGSGATNWGHVLGATLDTHGAQGKTARHVLLEHGARFVKRTTG